MDWDSEHTEAYQKRKNPSPPFSNPATTVGIYTVLSILMAMKAQLGLEAMLEYTGRYLQIIEKHNPEVKKAVHKALKVINVEVLYSDAMRKDRK